MAAYAAGSSWASRRRARLRRTEVRSDAMVPIVPSAFLLPPQPVVFCFQRPGLLLQLAPSQRGAGHDEDDEQRDGQEQGGQDRQAGHLSMGGRYPGAAGVI